MGISGSRFGRYEVLTEIASGGMATVYLARALGAAGFQRLVAIKLMHPHYAKDDDFVAMFLDEARLAAQIRHPNVVGTLDLEHDARGLYLVMEYVEGDVLLGLLRHAAHAGTRIPAPVAVRIALDALHGLHAAHELVDAKGEPLHLVHRDVSPHNVLVGTDGVAKITDFGVARAEVRMSTTRNGEVKGKIAYMAPEQTAPGQVDRRADVFAMGIVLWECLAGRRLFPGASEGEVIRNLLINPIARLRDVEPSVLPALDLVCAQALERDVAKRFATAAEFAEALELAAGPGGVAPPRIVAQYVQRAAGERIEALRARVRDLAPDVQDLGSAVRALHRARSSATPTAPVGVTVPAPPKLEIGRAPTLPGRAGARSAERVATAPAVDPSVELLLEDFQPTRRPTRRPLVLIAAMACVTALVAAMILRARPAVPPAAATAARELSSPRAVPRGSAARSSGAAPEGVTGAGSAVATPPNVAGTAPPVTAPTVRGSTRSRGGGTSSGGSRHGRRHRGAHFDPEAI